VLSAAIANARQPSIDLCDLRFEIGQRHTRNPRPALVRLARKTGQIVTEAALGAGRCVPNRTQPSIRLGLGSR
jgi:hypothetical protein